MAKQVTIDAIGQDSVISLANWQGTPLDARLGQYLSGRAFSVDAIALSTATWISFAALAALASDQYTYSIRVIVTAPNNDDLTGTVLDALAAVTGYPVTSYHSTPGYVGGAPAAPRTGLDVGAGIETGAKFAGYLAAGVAILAIGAALWAVSQSKGHLGRVFS